MNEDIEYYREKRIEKGKAALEKNHFDVCASNCADCKSPDRICNSWTITETSYPTGRVKLIIENQELGL